MADTIKVEFVGAYKDHKPGSTASLEPSEAKRVIRAGAARAATVKDAKAAGVDPADAATKK